MRKAFGLTARAGPRIMRAPLAEGIMKLPCRNASSSAPPTSSEMKKTPLYDLHIARGAKMVPFAGYSMPVQYTSASIAESHHFTRTHASLFDVSHMVQHIFTGPQAAAFLERLTPSDWKNQGLMQSKLTTFLWPGTGGIVDDCVITRVGEEAFFAVTNGACFEKDCAYLDEELRRFDGGGGVRWARQDRAGLIALQGPRAAEILREVLDDGPDGVVDLDRLYFGSAAYARLRFSGSQRTHPVLITRGGYTGEDGFEISFHDSSASNSTTQPAAAAAARDTTALFTESLLNTAGPARLQLAGLGARDSLRLEAGMCLYGHDLDDTTTPVEAGLSWVIAKQRRHVDAGFHGAETIVPQLTPKSKGGAGVSRRRIGLVVEGAPAREGADIQSQGQSIGTVTSGVPSPTLGKNIAMGYIRDGMHKAGTEVDVVVRGRKRSGLVTKMPFVPSRYYKPE
ncbi:hypothetical protein E4U54_001105 [Claviceps lovelessii]|nr:hypothetical protein E4U54_001105 [Claviceps lovelessii]